MFSEGKGGEREQGEPVFGTQTENKAILYVHLWVVAKEKNISPVARGPRISYLKRNLEKPATPIS